MSDNIYLNIYLLLSNVRLNREKDTCLLYVVSVDCFFCWEDWNRTTAGTAHLLLLWLSLTVMRSADWELNTQYEVPTSPSTSLYPSQCEPSQSRNLQNWHQTDHPGCSKDGEVCWSSPGGSESEQEHSAEDQLHHPGQPVRKVDFRLKYIFFCFNNIS